jgi:hypothetical protein
MSRYCWECSKKLAKKHHGQKREIATGEWVHMHASCAKRFDARAETVHLCAIQHDDHPGRGVAASDTKGAKQA